MTSTGTCHACGHRPNAVHQLYAELSNDRATWTDAVFWMATGAAMSALIEVGIEQLLRVVLP